MGRRRTPSTRRTASWPKYGVAQASSPTTPKSHNTMHRRKVRRAPHRSPRDGRSSGTRDRRGRSRSPDARAHRRVPHQVREALKDPRPHRQPADVNTLIRLKSFPRGRCRLAAGDPPHALARRCSRRHERYMQPSRSSTPAMASIIDVRGEAVETEHGQSDSASAVFRCPVRFRDGGGTEPVPAPARRGAPPREPSPASSRSRWAQTRTTLS